MRLTSLLRSARRRHPGPPVADPVVGDAPVAPAAVAAREPDPVAVPAEDVDGTGATSATPTPTPAASEPTEAEVEEGAEPAPVLRVKLAIDPPPETATLLAEADALIAAGDATAAVRLLADANRRAADPFVEHRLVYARYRAVAELDVGPGRSVWPPEVEDRFAGVDGCPTVEAADLDADTIASAVRHHGSLIVRGLIPPADVERLTSVIDRACDARDADVFAPVGTPHGSWYQPFRSDVEAEGLLYHRWWVKEAGGVLAVDSPPALFTMTEIFAAAGVREVVGDYLGEPPVISMDKCTLRRVPLALNQPEWHQDGQFLGEGIRVLNLWLALSPCGGSYPSPGLDVVPRRFDEIVTTGTGGAILDWAVGHGEVLRQSADTPVIRPEFQAGDAMFFDEMFLHRTALDDTMTEERYAIECWFFAPSAYPGKNAPVLF